MNETRSIAYQGEPGANSHIACLDNYPHLSPLPCATFEDAFAAVQDGSAELGMIPIENSVAGRVADIHALLPASGLHIVAETFMPIHFQLLAAPGARIEDLRTVHSHVHALGQCRKIIRRHNLKPVVASDTAGSAREVAEWADKSRASLATKLESYMEGGHFTATQFLADADGHPGDPPLKRALEELKFFSRETRVLGVYPAHPYRSESQGRSG